MLPVVSIVGKENVGKSTLFNRLAGARHAVIHSKPGITRDRNVKEINLFGTHLVLVDTGGYFPYESQGMRAKIKEQVEISLETTTLILFVVDVKSGMTPGDSEIGKRLRKLDKEIILVINKVDNPKREQNINEFYKLGFPEIIPISALQGLGINGLIDKISETIGQEKEEKQIETPKFAIIGRPNVGKSTYINALLQEPRMIVDEKPGTTIDSIDITLKYENKLLTLIDTPGLRRRTKIDSEVEYYSSLRSILTISRCDVAILLVDTKLTHQDKRIISILIKQGKGIVVAVNKIDLGVKFRGRDLRFANLVPVTYMSALNRKRIYEPIKEALRVQGARCLKISRKKLNAIVKSWDKPKVIYLAQSDTEPPTFKIRSKKPLTVSQMRFVENQLRTSFGFSGTPIRLISLPG